MESSLSVPRDVRRSVNKLSLDETFFRRRNLGIAALLLALPVSAYVLTLLAPQICFAKSSAFGNVTVYSESDVDPRWEGIIEDALLLVQRAEHFEPSSEFRIFLVAGSGYQTLEGLLVSPVMAKASRNNVFFNGGIDFESGQLIGPAVKMDLVRTLAHELTHCVDNAWHGSIEARKFELWKREGYAEYIAHGEDRHSPSYRLADTASVLHDAQATRQSWIDLHDGIMLPRYYVRARVLVEHLLENKQMTYDEIIGSSLTESDVYDDAMAWIENLNIIVIEQSDGRGAADSAFTN